jgi:peptide deformylase
MQVVTLNNQGVNILRQQSSPVTADELPELASTIESMKQLLSGAYDGIGKGLAAPQVGINKRFFVLRFGNRFQTFINPEIIKMGDVKTETAEGCLSIPDQWFVVSRSRKIDVRYLDENLQVRKCRFHDFDAIAFQHELDHLDGILICDKGREVAA